MRPLVHLVTVACSSKFVMMYLSSTNAPLSHLTQGRHKSIQTTNYVKDSECLKTRMEKNGRLVQRAMYIQAFRFMVELGHCPVMSIYGLSISKVVGPVDPLFLVVKKSQFNKNIYLKESLRTPQNSCQYSKTCLKQPLKKRQNKDFNNKW